MVAVKGIPGPHDLNLLQVIILNEQTRPAVSSSRPTKGRLEAGCVGGESKISGCNWRIHESFSHCDDDAADDDDDDDDDDDADDDDDDDDDDDETMVMLMMMTTMMTMTMTVVVAGGSGGG